MKSTKWKICQCLEFKCGEGNYQDEHGKNQIGTAFSLSAFKKHQASIKRLNKAQQVPSSVLPLQGSSHVSNNPDRNIVQPNIQIPLDREGQWFDTQDHKHNSFHLVPRHSLHVLLQAANLCLVHQVSDSAITNFLKTEREKIENLGREFNFDSDHIIKAIPLSKSTLIQRLGFEPILETRICCPECFKLYLIPDKSMNPESSLKKCTAKFYSTSKMFVRQTVHEQDIYCNTELLMKTHNVSIKPAQTFQYQSLKVWLGRKLWLPEFEKLIESNLCHQNLNANLMSDVWDGSVWRNFVGGAEKNKRFTQQAGHLVFSLYVDWFNPFGNKVGKKSISMGAVILICLNIPLAERYKVENVFLFGIIPGPKEPKADQINNILDPLVDELNELWKGVWFSETSQFPQGREIYVALFPLIGDLPAMRKVAGFSGHSSSMFCSYCQITKDDIDEPNINKFHPRRNLEHMKSVKKWEECQTSWERDEITKEKGVRSSSLNKLPYWRPIEYSVIELMHGLILGNLKDHSMSYLNIAFAGDELRKEKIKEKNRRDKVGLQKKNESFIGKGKRRKSPQDESEEGDHLQRSSKRRLNSSNLRALTQITEESSKCQGSRRYELRSSSQAGTSSSASEQSKKSQPSSENTSTHSYGLRSRLLGSLGSSRSIASEGSQGSRASTVKLIGGEGSSEVEDDEEGKAAQVQGTIKGPRLMLNDLRCIQQVIEDTKVPSWMTRVPKNVGFRSAGSLKAAEWLTLYMVYYPLALIPLWSGKHGPASDQIGSQKALQDSTVLLLYITNILMKHHISNKEILEVGQLMLDYRQTLRNGWPQQRSKPNVHITQHYPEVIKRFGPPMATAAWAHERLNGILGRIPKNNRTGDIHGTIMKTFNQRAQYSGLLIQSRLTNNGDANTNPRLSLTPLDPETHELWIQEVRRLGLELDVSLDYHVHKITSTLIHNKRFTVQRVDHGKNHSNSFVEIMKNGLRSFGQIIELFVRSEGGDVWFVIQLFQDAHSEDAEDPYTAIPKLNVRVVSKDLGEIVVVRGKEIVGHVAVLDNDAGTFGYPFKTMTLVSLGHLVSFPSN